MSKQSQIGFKYSKKLIFDFTFVCYHNALSNGTFQKEQDKYTMDPERQIYLSNNNIMFGQK